MSRFEDMFGIGREPERPPVSPQERTEKQPASVRELLGLSPVASREVQSGKLIPTDDKIDNPNPVHASVSQAATQFNDKGEVVRLPRPTSIGQFLERFAQIVLSGKSLTEVWHREQEKLAPPPAPESRPRRTSDSYLPAPSSSPKTDPFLRFHAQVDDLLKRSAHASYLFTGPQRRMDFIFELGCTPAILDPDWQTCAPRSFVHMAMIRYALFSSGSNFRQAEVGAARFISLLKDKLDPTE